MAPDSNSASRFHDRSTAQRYTMKTSRPPLTSSHSHHSQSHHRPQAHRISTPAATASPRMAHSVGQPYPPPTKLSPSLAGGDARSASPNYFGFAADYQSPNSRDANHVPHGHWSPPSSSVKSFGAAIPEQLPIDANPEFEAFRRQADANRNKSFSLHSQSHEPAPRGGIQPAPSHSQSQSQGSGDARDEGRDDAAAPASFNPTRPKPARRPTNQSDGAPEHPALRLHHPRGFEGAGRKRDVDADSLHDSAYVSSDSKRNSEVSLNPPSFSNLRFESPAQVDSPFDPSRRSLPSKADDRQSRLSLPMNRMDQSSPDSTKPRSETLPTTLESGPGLMPPQELKDVLERLPEQDYLLLDLRVSTHYAQRRIRSALNLCIPTTLLKRATFDLQKLQKTLQTEEDQKKFSEWSAVKYLVVYDNSSNEKRDATSAVNMLKKFTNEGFGGRSCILKGGFDGFSQNYPGYIDTRSATQRAGNSAAASNGGPPLFAPVIGGVSLPAAAETPNPFFNNIRQNVDLADGVGQLDISVPSAVDVNLLPPWLREAADAADHGKKVSNKFLDIERREQSRMREAYSAFNSNLRKGNGPAAVQLSGVEKGVKNRYKDILPFEHARVRLPDRSAGDCDYINASHIQASRSKKRYIASQGPLPATYEDFWSVVWDQDVRVIVMLTAESEGGQLKCHPYWQSKDFGPIKLKPLQEKKVSLDIDKPRVNNSSRFPLAVSERLSEASRRRASTANAFESNFASQAPQQQSETPYVIIRKFALSHTAHPFAPMREITHLYYPSWPDFGAPAQPSHLLALIELANVMQRAALPVDANAIAASVATETSVNINWFDDPETDAQARPMMVHCSAGCGRTGTFCTIDSVIDMLKRQRLASHEIHDAEGDVSMENSPISPSSVPVPALGKSAESSLAKLVASKGSESESWVSDVHTDLIATTVEDLRSQRLSMVQSLRQFVLCYETVLEWAWRFHEKTSAIGRLRMNRGDARFSIS